MPDEAIPPHAYRKLFLKKYSADIQRSVQSCRKSNVSVFVYKLKLQQQNLRFSGSKLKIMMGKTRNQNIFRTWLVTLVRQLTEESLPPTPGRTAESSGQAGSRMEQDRGRDSEDFANLDSIQMERELSAQAIAHRHPPGIC
jgi:hypothetical protein